MTENTVGFFQRTDVLALVSVNPKAKFFYLKVVTLGISFYVA